jgi:hypothetical protein
VYAGRGILQYLRSSLPVESVEGDEERTVLRVDEGRLPGIPWTLEAGSDASRMYFEAGWSPPRDEAGRKVRRAAAGRSTLLFRRPSPGPLDLVLVLVGGSEGEAVSVEGRLGGDEVGRHAWRSAVTTVRWRLPPARGSVERLWLRWSGAWAGMVEARFEPVT